MTKLHNILDKVSYHAVYDDSIIDALQYAKDNGFSGVQVAIEAPHLSFENLSDRERTEIKKFTTKNKMRLSLHAPDETASLFESNRYLKQGIFNFYSALFSFAQKVGAQIITIHIGSMTTFRTDTVPEEELPQIDLPIYQATLRNNLRELIDLANDRFILCVENYKLDKMILDILQPYRDGNQLSLCWDLAKTFDPEMKKDKQLERYFWKNIKYIRQVQLHDLGYNHLRKWRSHRVIGSGKMDFMYFLSRLSLAAVLDYCIEVHPREKASESLTNLKKLIQQG